MYRYSAVGSPPNNCSYHLSGHCLIISQPEVNFTVCNLHMFIYRNLISVISNSLFSHMLKVFKYTHTHHEKDLHFRHPSVSVKFFYKFKANYIVPDWIHSDYDGNCWLILKMKSLWNKSYFSKRHWWLCIDIHFQKGPASKRILWLCSNYVGWYSILQNCTAFPLLRQLIGWSRTLMINALSIAFHIAT